MNAKRSNYSRERLFAVLMIRCGMYLLLGFAATGSFGQPADNLPPLAPPHGEMPPTFWEQHGTMILIGGAGFIVVIALLVWRMLQPKPMIILPPEVMAREALRQLADQPEDGRLLSHASQILRRYIVAVFDLSPLEMTTAEFCAALGANGKIGVPLAGSICAFLRECDERKFSPATSSSSFNAVNRALELVSQAEIRRAKMRELAAAST